MRYLYSLLFYLALPLIFLRLLRKGRKNPVYRQRWRERLGFIKAVDGPCIWLHAVSVGELLAAKPLINALRSRYPDYALVITSMTATGSELAAQFVNDKVSRCYVPYDLPGAVNRFLNRTQPCFAIIMETELWPNLLHYTAKRNIPILLANARLSQQSAQGYQRIRPFVKTMLQAFSLIAAQSAQDAERFIALGANPAKVAVLGNIKFDVPIPEDLITKGRSLRASWEGQRPIVMAASTHAGEEEQVLQAFTELSKAIPNALLILVPRHQERFSEVATLCEKQGFATVRRSSHQPCTAHTQIFLGDSLGELFLYYACADVTFVGGSFIPVGGHNVLEPAALHLPIAVGPQMFNFSEVLQLLQAANAIRQIANGRELAKLWQQWLENPAEAAAMGERARQVVEQNRGALDRHINYIASHIKQTVKLA